MKRYFCLTILFQLIFINLLSSKPISIEIANKVAESILLKNSEHTLANYGIKLVYVVKDETNTLNGVSQNPYFYVYSGMDKSFLIVSGDDVARPILAFSIDGDFPSEELPPNLRYWLNYYKEQIKYARENNLQANAQIAKEWALILSGGNINITNYPEAVTPLIKTKWNQAPFYNDYCPYDDSRQSKTVAGCVAIAMAQVMKYWAYPTVGQGRHSYNHYKLGTISASFDDFEINWNSFPNQIFTKNDELAYTIFLLGVSVEMRYGVDASGAYVISKTSPKQHCSEYAMKTYWKYEPKTLRGLPRTDTTITGWYNIIKNELRLGRPLLYTGFGPDGGHAWVCDGYREDNYFYMNWGWGGSYNGYYSLTALEPGTGGIGAGSGTFNEGQEILYGIQPMMDNASILTLTGNTNFEDTPLGSTSQRTIYLNNLGTKPITISTADAPQSFSINTQFPITLLPGESIPVNVVFSPKYATTYTGNITFTTNANYGVNQISVRGKGVANTSVNDNKLTTDVYPNPASDFINILSDDALQKIEIFDIYGCLLITNSISKGQNFKIDITQLPIGSYIIKIIDEKGSVNYHKLLISR